MWQIKKNNISTKNLFSGFLRLSIFTSCIIFCGCFFIETQKHAGIAFGISDQDARDLRKSATIIIDGHECTYKEGREYPPDSIKIENKYKIKELDQWISTKEKEEIIRNYYEYWNRFGSRDLYICRASYSCDDIIDRALKKIIQSESFIDYSTGYLVSNQKHGIKNSYTAFIENDDEHHDYFTHSPDGYSIIPSYWEKIKWGSKIAALWAFLAFVCTSLFCPIICCIFYYILLIPIMLRYRLRSYFLWVKRGFIQ